MSQPDEELQFISVPSSDSGTGMSNSSAPGGIVTGGSSAIGGGASNGLIASIAREAKHPVACFFHVAFKIAALFFFVFGGWITSNDVFLFVLIIVSLACDFWTVKNVSGRLLVGMRWWNNINDEGNNDWVFESLEDMSDVGAVDARVFWWALYMTPTIWTFFLIVALLKLQLQWCLIIGTAIVLSGANIYGYTKCSKDAEKKMQDLGQAAAKMGALSKLATSSSSLVGSIGTAAFGKAMSMFGGGGGGSSTGQEQGNDDRV